MSQAECEDRGEEYFSKELKVVHGQGENGRIPGQF